MTTHTLQSITVTRCWTYQHKISGVEKLTYLHCTQATRGQFLTQSFMTVNEKSMWRNLKQFELNWTDIKLRNGHVINLYSLVLKCWHNGSSERGYELAHPMLCLVKMLTQLNRDELWVCSRLTQSIRLVNARRVKHWTAVRWRTCKLLTRFDNKCLRT